VRRCRVPANALPWATHQGTSSFQHLGQGLAAGSNPPLFEYRTSLGQRLAPGQPKGEGKAGPFVAMFAAGPGQEIRSISPIFIFDLPGWCSRSTRIIVCLLDLLTKPREML
jgi:hypothetical protein